MSEDVRGADPGEPRRPQLRISDRDREVVADALREAYAEGRLTYAEHDERLERVWQARTAADLEPLVEDLPVGGDVVPRHQAPPAPVPAAGAPAPRPAPHPLGHGMPALLPLPGGSGLALLSSATMRPPAQATSAAGAAVLGNLVVDLVDCLGGRQPQGRVFQLTVNALLGSAEVLVPEGVEVRMSGSAVLGSRQVHGDGRGAPGGAVLVVDGVALLGSVDVRRRPRQQD